MSKLGEVEKRITSSLSSTASASTSAPSGSSSPKPTYGSPAAAARLRSERRGSLLLWKWTVPGEEEVEVLGTESRGREARAGVVAGWTDMGSMVSFRIREEEDDGARVSLSLPIPAFSALRGE
jgi:hypothetical protein